jgi:uncharacterized protein
MKYLFFIIFFFALIITSRAQCFSGNCKNGKGEYFYPQDSSSYNGEFKNALKHGFGEFQYSNGNVYKGEWKKDLRHGKGVLTFENGDKYEGDWKEDKRTGKGKYTWLDGTNYEGDYVDNEMHGIGKIVWPSGAFYIGDWLNSNMEGNGELHYDEGTVEKGIFKADTLFQGNTSYKENNLSYTAFNGDTTSTLIIDAAAAIDDQTKKVISDLLWAEYHKTSNTVMVFTIPTLNGQTIEEYANQTFNRLQLGKEGKNNGILLLIAVNDRKMRIEVGYGLEGVLPDILTQHIQQQDIIPSFKEGKMSEGILNGVKGILSVLQDPKNAELYASDPSSSEESGRSTGTMYVLNLLILLACINSAYYGQYGRFIFSSVIMLWFSLIITYKDQYGIGFSNSFLLHTGIYYLIYFIIRAVKAGKIKASKKGSFIYQFFYNNSVKYETSSGGSGSSYSRSGYSSSSSSSSSYSSSSSSSSWSGGGSSGGGGSSSSW